MTAKSWAPQALAAAKPAVFWSDRGDAPVATPPLTENIEVIGSHSGMAMHPMALHVIADRLGQRLESWTKFDRRRGLRSCLFPNPAPPPAA